MVLFACGLLMLGALLVLISAIGVIRFPTALARQHALGLGSTVGIGLLLAGVALSTDDSAAKGKALLTMVFLLVTAPIGSHMIGRIAYIRNSVVSNLRKDEWGARENEPPEN